MASPQIIPIYHLDQGEETFYVPTFEVRIEGRELPPQVIRDVMEVTYKDSVNEIDSFELKINNWDADTLAFKYVGLPNELRARTTDQRSSLAQIFDPGQELKLFMGYNNNVRLMIEGQITALEPDYPASGSPTLTVRGLNVLHTFRKKQHTWSWRDKTDSDIAKELGRNQVSDDRPGLGVRVVVDDAVNDEAPEDFIFMNNQYDIVFLLERARRHGYSLYLRRNERTGERLLHYGYADAQRIRDVTYELIWGRSLIQFRPTLTTANQISRVTVRGWNRQTKRAIEGTAKLGDRGLNINDDQTAVARAVEGRHEVIVNRPVFTQPQARAMARDILRNQLKEMVKATGSTVGLPDLRAGRKVLVKNLGQRFSGEYFVTGSTHTINDGGYITRFEARREKGLEGEQ
jgi:phage protein D